MSSDICSHKSGILTREQVNVCEKRPRSCISLTTWMTVREVCYCDKISIEALLLLCSIDFAVDPRTNEDANSTCSDTEEGKLYNNIPLGTLSCIDTLFFHYVYRKCSQREAGVSQDSAGIFHWG